MLYDFVILTNSKSQKTSGFFSASFILSLGECGFSRMQCLVLRAPCTGARWEFCGDRGGAIEQPPRASWLSLDSCQVVVNTDKLSQVLSTKLEPGRIGHHLDTSD